MSFGKRLRDARLAKGLTQAELGVGLSTDGEDASKAVVYGWEKGQHFPRVDQLALICQKLGCGADWLLFGNESEAGLSPDAAQVAREFDSIADPDDKAHVFDLLMRNINFGKLRSAPDTSSNNHQGRAKSAG